MGCSTTSGSSWTSRFHSSDEMGGSGRPPSPPRRSSRPGGPGALLESVCALHNDRSQPERRRTAMDIAIKTGPSEKLQTGVLVVGAFADGTLPAATRTIDEASKGKLSADPQAWRPGGEGGRRAAAARPARHRGGARAAGEPRQARRVRRQGLPRRARRRGQGPRRRRGAKDAAVTLADVELPGRSLAWRLEQASRLLADGAYRFDARKAAGNARQSRSAGRARSAC